jgi:uncharacterized protein
MDDGGRTLDLCTRYGPNALVAGAAEGIGEAWVHRLLAEGFTAVVAVDRSKDGLDALMARVADADRARVVPVVADLGEPDAWHALDEAITAHPPCLLVCNAAAAPDGRFADQPLEMKLVVVEVNAAAPLRLLDRVLPGMRAEGRGGVVLMSSLSAAAAAPRLAVYAATKAYLLSLAQSLNVELRGEGIDVVAIMPGRVATPGFLQTRHAQTRAGRNATKPAEVVDAGVSALGRRPLVVPGRANQFGAFLLGRVLPRRTANDLMARVIEKTAPGDG